MSTNSRTGHNCGCIRSDYITVIQISSDCKYHNIDLGYRSPILRQTVLTSQYIRQTKVGRATDTCFAIIGAHQCVMTLDKWLALYPPQVIWIPSLPIEHTVKHWHASHCFIWNHQCFTCGGYRDSHSYTTLWTPTRTKQLSVTLSSFVCWMMVGDHRLLQIGLRSPWPWINLTELVRLA